MGLNITGIVLLLGLPIGYAVYKLRCCGIVKTIQELKCLGNDGTGDNTSINCE